MVRPGLEDSSALWVQETPFLVTSLNSLLKSRQIDAGCCDIWASRAHFQSEIKVKRRTMSVQCHDGPKNLLGRAFMKCPLVSIDYEALKWTKMSKWYLLFLQEIVKTCNHFSFTRVPYRKFSGLAYSWQKIRIKLTIFSNSKKKTVF